MNYFLTEIKVALVVILSVLLPANVFAQSGSQVCLSSGYTVATINGVLTKNSVAIKNRDDLKYYFDKNYNGEPLTFEYLFNPTHLGGLGDLASVIVQKAFETETVADYDLIEMLKDASQKVKTQKLLLVAHSQGNFYANSFYDVVTTQAGGVPAQSIGVYGVANPASRVVDSGTRWLTSETDKVIAWVVGNVPFKNIMLPNVRIKLQDGDNIAGHGFSEVYLKYSSNRIVEDIQYSLNRLSKNTIQNESAPCMSPPKITLAHKQQGVIYAVTDPVLNPIGAGALWAFGKGVNGAMLAYNTGTSAVNAVGQVTYAVSDAVYNAILAALSSGTVAGNNSATAILATDSIQNTATTNNQVVASADQIIQTSAQTSRTPPVQTTTPVIVFNATTKTTSVDSSKLVFAASFGTGAGSGSSSATAPQVLGTNTAINESAINQASSESNTTITPIILSTPALYVPQCTQTLATDGCLLATTTVRFEWTAVAGADHYLINKNGEFSTTTATTSSPTVKDFSEYTLEVVAIDSVGNVSATSTQKVSVATIPIAINEIAWMGTVANTSDEWIEIKNNTGHIINISKWRLIAKDGLPNITLVGVIKPHEYIVLERTDEETIKDISAHGFFTGDLNNSGDQLSLLYGATSTSTPVTIDQTPAGAWSAGYNSTTTRKSMERHFSKESGTSTSNWATNLSYIKNGTDAKGNAISGTPGAENSINTPPPPDIAPPIITIKGSNPVVIFLGATYNDEGVTAEDAVDGVRPTTTTSKVDTSRVDTYTITYTAEDLSHNLSVAVRIVKVVDIADYPMTPSYSDLNSNGIADENEANVVATSTKSLLAGEYHFHNLTITNNATLFLGGDKSNSTSSAYLGVRIIADNLTVTPGASISADGKGYSTGPGVGTGSVGASYGGVGGGNTATSTYGSATRPKDLGSGAGGARGGGAIRISASGTFLNDGTISANGSGLRTSGGSIYVTTNNIAGIGAFTAKGGDTTWPNSFAGSGGRIAIYSATSTFSGNAKANAGVYCMYGCNPAAGAGTVGFFDTTTNDFYAGPSWKFQKKDEPFNFNNITLANSAGAEVEMGVAVMSNNIYIKNSSWMSVADGANISTHYLGLEQSSYFTILGSAVLNIPTIDIGQGSTLTLSGSETLTSDTMNIKNGGTLTVSKEHVLFLNISNLNISAGSFISANSKGYGPGFGHGIPATYHAGASYGGVGYWNDASSTYGSVTEPIDFGSGGNGYHTAGGGAIRLIVTNTFANNGTVSADGENTSSGGSIYVTANNISGGGSYHANGGSFYCPNACIGMGGGGRIALYHATSSFIGNVSAKGGCNSFDGWTRSCAGDGSAIVEKKVPPAPTPVPNPQPTLVLSTPLVVMSILKQIEKFDVLVATTTVIGIIDESTHTINITVPFGSEVNALSPIIIVSPLATSSPASLAVKDFTSPIVYKVIAEDGSAQEYVVTVAIDASPSSPIGEGSTTTTSMLIEQNSII